MSAAVGDRCLIRQGQTRTVVIALSKDREVKPKRMAVPTPTEITVLLIGKTGDGKSATANTILGKEEFKSAGTQNAVTNECQWGSTERFGRKLVVVDTPGLCDSEFPHDVIRRELFRALGFTAPGFHAIIFVIRAGRYTEECVKVRDTFFNWFGSNVADYSLILFTGGDEMPQDFFENNSTKLQEFMDKCGGRRKVFNNKAPKNEKEKQVQNLISEVDKLFEENKGQHFTNSTFRWANFFNSLINRCTPASTVRKDAKTIDEELGKMTGEFRKNIIKEKSDEVNERNIGAKTDEPTKEEFAKPCEPTGNGEKEETSLRDNLKQVGVLAKFIKWITNLFLE